MPRSGTSRRPARSTARLGGRPPIEAAVDALARLYDLDLAEDPGDLELYLALASRTGGPIVELAVGTGRVAVPLAAAGHAVTGIDLDPAMLARARARAAAAGEGVAARLELVEADGLRPRPADSGRFALAILALNSILLFATRADQERIVQAMAGLVAPGGLVVIDAWQPQPIDLARMDGRVSLEWLRDDPEAGRQVTKHAAAWYDPSARVAGLITIFEEGRQGEAVVRWTRTDRLRLVSGEELAAWAEAAGLEVERLAGDHDLSPAGPASDRAVLVARRPA